MAGMPIPSCRLLVDAEHGRERQRGWATGQQTKAAGQQDHDLDAVVAAEAFEGGLRFVV
jgi:hypothetical protein